MPIRRHFALQLFALGYGCCELHLGDLLIRDNTFKFIRSCVQYFSLEPLTATVNYRRSSISLTRTLYRCSNIAIRRAGGGIDYK